MSSMDRGPAWGTAGAAGSAQREWLFLALVGGSIAVHGGLAVALQVVGLPHLPSHITASETAIDVGFAELVEPPAPQPVAEPLTAEPATVDVRPVVMPEPTVTKPLAAPVVIPEVVARPIAPPARERPRPSPSVTETPLVVLTETRPDYLRNPPPRYPRVARRKGWQGTTLLRVDVSASGDPTDVEVIQSSGYPVLDEASQQAVETWRFVPARRGDRPVESTVEVPITYRLRDQRSE